ncbi:MAG TPA: PAS domain S-box protein [Chitinophagales bacterium]|nr:PAS domain S-box protein [Chitinophagales bacterium]
MNLNTPTQQPDNLGRPVVRSQQEQSIYDLSRLLESTDEVLLFADYKQQKITRISASCYDVFGYKPEDFLVNYTLLNQIIYAEDKNVVEKNTDLLKQGIPVKYHCRIVHKNGSTRNMSVKMVPTLSSDGELDSLCGIIRDITTQKNTNRALLESEYLYRQFFENAYEAILVIDASTGLIQDYNKNALNLFKIDPSDILVVTPARFCPRYQPDGQKSTTKAANILKHLIHERALVCEWILCDTTGKEILCELNFVSVTNNNSTHIRISIVDVTEKKQAKAKLIQQENLYSKLLENITDGVSLINATGEITYQSPSAVKIMGLTLEDLHGVTIFDLVYPEDLSGLSAFFETAYNNPGIPYSSQFRFRHKEGHYLWVEGTVSNMLHDENIKAFIANYRNIEERKQAEAEISALNELLEKRVKERTAQLLEANRELETFNYTVSHDLQAPLRSTCGFAKILLEDYKDKLDEEGQRFLKIIADSSLRMSHLIHDLLDFSRLGKQELSKRMVSMDDIVKVVIDEVKFNTGNPHFKLQVSPLCEAECDASLLKQVWLNLIGNAVKYSGKNPDAVIEIGCKRVNGEVIYYVKDNGAGFDMKFANKLFTVFKRMHHTDEFEGTGVGLATVQRIISRHGGRVWAEAEVNKGATFYFVLGA